MYEVYINETPLRLVDEQDVNERIVANEQNLVGRYLGKTKFLLQYVDMLEKSDRFESVTLFSNDLRRLIADFEQLFKIVEASGGLVFNQQSKALVIFRRGFWDLPKGKIDAGETKTQAAIREVQEETGLKQLDLEDFLCETRHTYRNKKNQRCIKLTYWYQMTTADTTLVPQTEEDIEQAVWVELADFLAEQPKIYNNILKVIAAFNRRKG